MNKYDEKKLKAADKAGSAFAVISGVFLCISTVFMFLNMVTRTVADVNIRFVYELCGLCAAGVASFAIPYATLKSAHSTMDIITSHLKPRARAALEAVSGLVTIVVMSFTVYILSTYAYQRTLVLETTTTSELPTYMFRWVYALGMLLTTAAVIVETVDRFRTAAGKDVAAALEESGDSGKPDGGDGGETV